MKTNLKAMAVKWASGYVARSEIRRFTGGAVAPGTMANLDSRGLGPQGGIRLGRKVVYPVHDLIAWLESRVKVEVPVAFKTRKDQK